MDSRVKRARPFNLNKLLARPRQFSISIHLWMFALNDAWSVPKHLVVLMTMKRPFSRP